MSNFSDEEDLITSIAKGRSEEWSDDDDDEAETALIPPVAEAGVGASWSDDDDDGETDRDKEPIEEEEEPKAGAIFGSKADPIGDLRTQAKTMKRRALDGVDKYVKSAAAEAKKVRASRKKIAGLRDKSLKALQRVEKDKNLTDSAKTAQRAQHETFTGPTTGELARIDAELAENEDWLNRILSQRQVPSAAAVAKAKRIESIKLQIGPRSSTGEKTLERNAILFLPAGMELFWSESGENKTHAGIGDGDHFAMKASAKYTISNRSDRTASCKLIYH